MTKRGHIKLRTATIHDLPLLLHWDEQPHVIASDPDDEWGWASELKKTPPWREQLIAELDGRPIGFIQIIDPEKEESHYWGDVQPNLRAIDIWIGEPTDLGKGYGTDMMKQAIKRCFNDPEVTAILIDPLVSNIDAIRFYKRLRFKFVERRTFGDTDCEVYKLRREKTGPLKRNDYINLTKKSHRVAPHLTELRYETATSQPAIISGL